MSDTGRGTLGRGAATEDTVTTRTHSRGPAVCHGVSALIGALELSSNQQGAQAHGCTHKHTHTHTHTDVEQTSEYIEQYIR